MGIVNDKAQTVSANLLFLSHALVSVSALVLR